jgi:hypothetical protein
MISKNFDVEKIWKDLYEMDCFPELEENLND